MSWTDAETTRVEAIEKVLNKVQEAIKNLASQQQLRSLAALKQTELNDLKNRVTSLETAIALLQKGS